MVDPQTQSLQGKVAQLEAKLKAAVAETKLLTKNAKKTEAKFQDCTQENELLLLQLMQAQEELVEYHEKKSSTNSAATQKALSEAQSQLDARDKELKTLKSEYDKQAKSIKKAEAKSQDATHENELLLLQLAQAQEELLVYHDKKVEFEKLYLAYKARWDRLETSQPNYVDFGSTEIVSVDGVSDIPTIIWRVKDYAQAGVALSEFSFATVLQDGHPGIGLVHHGEPQAFVPKLLSTHKDQLATFVGLGTLEFKQLTAALSILGQLEAAQWQGFAFPPQFDLSFWRPSLQTLLAQLRQMPVMLRYDQVRLKRELINPDYEHLWLEFVGLSMGAAQWKKLEIRLGAALVQPYGFSQYPKFEIPLIDGKTKPFDSWYAESMDDSGAKLELRFALDKNTFDTTVWAKLAEADKALVLRLIYAMPDALRRLDKQKAAIHRPWATWVDFASGAVRVLDANKASTPVEEKPAQAPTQEVAKQLVKTASAPIQLLSGAGGGGRAAKVITFASQPVAHRKKPTTTTTRKKKA